MRPVPALIDPAQVADGALAVLRETFGSGLLGLAAHGSWVHGDFEPARSDVDLLAVLADDPGPSEVQRLGAGLDALLRRHPGWADRVELGLVSTAAVREVVDTGCSDRVVGRLSPGEPLHLARAEPRRLLDWDAAARGRTLHGPPGLLPQVPWSRMRPLLLEELAMWPAWLDELEGDDALAYAVLSVARTAAYATTATPHSKRAGARWISAHLPRHAQLAWRAETLWYRPSTTDALDRGEVAAFVDEVLASAWCGP